MGDALLESSAVFSDDGRYRYELVRRWGPGRLALWVMLNPSTADAEQDDPTIRRVIGFTKRWSLGDGIVVANLFALRSTDPAELLRAENPVGPENVQSIRRRIRTSHVVIGAWGAHPAVRMRGAPSLVRLAEDEGRKVYCLGVTKAGEPRHPLYVAGETPIVDLDVARYGPRP